MTFTQGLSHQGIVDTQVVEIRDIANASGPIILKNLLTFKVNHCTFRANHLSLAEIFPVRETVVFIFLKRSIIR